jgi:hypothetical protein
VHRGRVAHVVCHLHILCEALVSLSAPARRCVPQKSQLRSRGAMQSEHAAVITLHEHVVLSKQVMILCMSRWTMSRTGRTGPGAQPSASLLALSAWRHTHLESVHGVQPWSAPTLRSATSLWRSVLLGPTTSQFEWQRRCAACRVLQRLQKLAVSHDVAIHRLLVSVV